VDITKISDRNITVAVLYTSVVVLVEQEFIISMLLLKCVLVEQEFNMILVVLCSSTEKVSCFYVDWIRGCQRIFLLIFRSLDARYEKVYVLMIKRDRQFGTSFIPYMHVWI